MATLRESLTAQVDSLIIDLVTTETFLNSSSGMTKNYFYIQALFSTAGVFLELSLIGPTVFRGQNLTNSAENLVNSAAHRGKADEIPRLTAVTQLNFRGLIKS